MFRIEDPQACRRQMPLYYFHVKESNGLLADPDGSHLPNIEAARAEAIEGARQLISTAVLTGEPMALERQMQVDDEHGQTLLTIPFRDVINPGDV